VDNHKKQAQKTKRLAIFSENDKKYLKGIRKLDTKMKSKFHKELNIRFNELLRDLELIARSDKLDVWRSHNRIKLEVYSKTNIFEQMLSNSQIMYVDTIRHKKLGKKDFFWVDVKPRENTRMDKRILQPQFLLRNMYGNPKEKFGDKLIEAYEKRLIPINKKEAISEKELRLLLSNKKKLKTHREISLKELEKEDFEQAEKMRKAQKIVNKYKKKLNERLKPLGFTMGQMSYG